MRIKLFQIDAFARKVFEGNPAAVCPLEHWLDDSLLKSIAMENNLSETAFFVPSKKGFQLRWFTPTTEVDLCGHATLAAGFVIFDILKISNSSILFETRSGDLFVERRDKMLVLNFPAKVSKKCEIPDPLVHCLGKKPLEVFVADDYIAVFETEDDILKLLPDFSSMMTLPLGGILATAKGSETDFVSRCFFPKLGVPEDPVTGAAHCELTPLWHEKLGKNPLSARQLSKRKGDLICEMKKDRVLLAGQAVKFMEGEIML